MFLALMGMQLEQKNPDSKHHAIIGAEKRKNVTSSVEVARLPRTSEAIIELWTEPFLDSSPKLQVKHHHHHPEQEPSGSYPLFINPALSECGVVY
jgi:hypothetical protein